VLNLDTHILLYALSDSLRKREHDLLIKSDWSISAIVLWEIAKLSQLGRIELDLNDPVVENSLAGVHVWPLNLEIARVACNLDFSSDPADEIISATSIVHKIPLLTRDKLIRRSKQVPLA